MSDVAIRVENLSKEYRIGGKQDAYKTLRDTLTHAFSSPFRRASKLLRGQATGAAELDESIWALKEVSFEVKRGEVIGIIGRNGAGKSTLLKILSRITEPTTGKAQIFGRVGSLLEVGSGFHPELTGRENIYLNGAILGMSRHEIERKFDEMVAFAEVEKFIDTPVKHYSSGMYLRLAFAVAAHLEPEILMVDEVLAVGDADFQKKCLGKMEDVAQEGRTVLFVSHNMGAIAKLCDQAILLNEGQITTSGAINDVIAHYLLGLSSESSSVLIEAPQKNEGVIIQRAELFDHELKSSSQLDYRFPFHITIEFRVFESASSLSLWIRLNNQHGIHVLFTWLCFRESYKPGCYRVSCQVPGELLTPGRYFLDIAAINYGVKGYHYTWNCLSFNVRNTHPRFNPNGKGWGVIFPQLPCTIEKI